MNAWMGRLNGLPDWQSADVGLTASLLDGRVLWVFGDTLRAASRSPRIVSNSAFVTTGLCAQPAVPRSHGALVPDPAARTACWPTSMASVPAPGEDRLLVACSRVKRQPGGLLAFTYLGLSLATLKVPRGGAPQVTGVAKVTPDDENPGQVNWGAAMIVRDGELYIYGTALQGSAGTRAAYLARVPPASATDRAAWRYFDGSGWTDDPSAARAVLPSSFGVSQAFSVIPWGGGVVAVSTQGGDLARSVAVWRAPAPTGPWTLASRAAVPAAAGGDVVYQPLAHPEIVLSSGNLLVSVSRNPAKLSDLFADPRRGRPFFLEVPRP
ncbi:DUF4185 domain-containing protein [Calidifontibacter sp. DB0510]|uniref:DUF4185 domain-containing protein n=1 Tax=Metallococcus carri TaxID=1656884 RepID=A0A967E972_9MICO|nr:DUF4185 domain-containing protein [Metallococcus carri]NHN56057.1 DUF4185 domain-containing protein [Metallococcus carri]NOP37486.1 DUF4185 domain-containing protein [Calidifontibacter sp. DB2511S]